MNGSFKLLIYAIVAISLIYIISTFVFNQCFFNCSNPVDDISKLLDSSQSELGITRGKKVNFQGDFGVNADIFDIGSNSGGRSVVFSCNNPVFCCPKKGNDVESECVNKIQWSDRSIFISQSKPIDIFTRCRFEELFICKIFVGKKPAQFEVETSFSKNLNLDLFDYFDGKLLIKNSGNVEAIIVDIKADLYQVFFENGKKYRKFVSENNFTLYPVLEKEVFPFFPGQEQEAPIKVPVIGPGKFELELIVFERTDETNYFSQTIEFEAIGGSVESSCKVFETETVIRKDYPIDGNCFIEYNCSGCKFGFECQQAVSALGISVSSEYGDKSFAAEIVPMSDFRCQK